MSAIEIAEQLEHSALGSLGDFYYVADAAKELRRLAGVEAELVALRKQEPVAWLDVARMSPGRMIYATSTKSTVDQVPVYAAPVPTVAPATGTALMMIAAEAKRLGVES